MAVLAENRAKLTLKRSAPGIYFNGPASPLRQHNGILFPYQPDITYQQSVAYSQYDMVHTNYTFNAYRNTPSPSIQMNAQFASVTEEEGAYTLGVIHFLRSISKMFSGLNQSFPTAGTPPPVLEFSAFGTEQFYKIPVVVTAFSVNFDSNVDLKLFKGGQQLPVLQNMFIDLSVQQNPDRQKRKFTTNSFIGGQAYKDGFI
jgi:hypothetical protein|tara:strand:+ start:140 stop:742 length:603 start_codon:yes stop_codon:yes gene_type:complete